MKRRAIVPVLLLTLMGCFFPALGAVSAPEEYSFEDPDPFPQSIPLASVTSNERASRTSLALGAEAGPVSPGVQKPMSFGSETILGSCWSEEELQGKPIAKPDLRPHGKSRARESERQLPMSSLPPIPPEMRKSIRSVSPDGKAKVVALTFDLCESEKEISGYDAPIVNYLRVNGVRATFFAGGKWMLSHPAETQQLMADPLFELGNHSWNHRNFGMLGKDAIEEQVLRTQAQYELLRGQLANMPCANLAGPQEMERIPQVPRTFRFPYGRCSTEALHLVGEHGLVAVQWDVVSGDPAKGQSAEGMAGEILKRVKPGSIVVFHANGRGRRTAEALHLLIPKLRSSGYTFVTISTLLTCGPVSSSEECYELTPKDNLRYDKTDFRASRKSPSKRHPRAGGGPGEP